MGLHFRDHTASSGDLSTTKRGELHDMRLRHADDTPPEGFMSCKTPNISCM